jgi:hypothetical protein
MFALPRPTLMLTNSASVSSEKRFEPQSFSCVGLQSSPIAELPRARAPSDIAPR